MKTKKNGKGGNVSNSGSAKYFNRIIGLNGNAARLSLYNPVGIPTPSDFFYRNRLSRVPGIMRIGMVPGPGYSDGSTSAVNVASNGITAYLTSNIGRPYAYDPQDYMQYILSYQSCVLHLVKLGKGIGLSLLVSGENRYVPDNLLAVSGWDASIKEQLADARWLFNYYANQLTKLNVPNTFTNINWQIKLLSNIFRDQDNLKAQLYVFDTDVYYIYDEATGTCGANKYAYVDGATGIIQANLLTLATWRTIMDNMLSPLLQSQNIGNMSSDTKKAFGERLFALPRINVDYTIDVIKDYEILNFIHNITLCGAVASSLPTGCDHYLNLSNLDITQDPTTGSLLWEPEIRVPSYAQVGTNILSYFASTMALDMPNDNPSEDEILVATRGKAEIGNISSGGAAKVIAAGTEIYTTALAVGGILPVGLTPLYLIGTTHTVVNSNTALAGAGDTVTAMTVFDWAPKIAVSIVDSSTYVFIAAVQLWEINNYTMLDHNTLVKINDGALASVYNIPEIGILK